LNSKVEIPEANGESLGDGQYGTPNKEVIYII
jgi:hypothetical protein